MEEKTESASRDMLGFWLIWIVLNVIGWGGSFYIGIFAILLFGVLTYSTIVGLVIGGMLAGLLIGFTQFLGLPELVYNRLNLTRWLLATMLAGAICAILVYWARGAGVEMIAGVLGGAIFGFAQSLVLHGIYRPGLWVLAALMGGAICGPLMLTLVIPFNCVGPVAFALVMGLVAVRPIPPEE